MTILAISRVNGVALRAERPVVRKTRRAVRGWSTPMLRKLLIVLVLVSFAATGLWYAGIPDRWAAGRIEALFSGGGIRTELYGFRKTPLFGFEVEEVRVVHSRKGLLRMEGLSGRVDPLSLAVFGLKVSFSGRLSGGTVSAGALLRRDSVEVSFEVRSARLEELDLLDSSAFRGSGSLDLTGTIEDGRGEFYIDMRGLALKDISMDGLYIPMGSFRRIKGAGSFTGRDFRVEAVSLEGGDVSARIRGLVFSKGYFKGRLEVLAGEGLPEARRALLEPYRQSRKYYVIPLKGRVRDLL